MIKKIHQFIPQKYEYLTKSSKIEYNGVNLKTAYLINIIHELILKYYFIEDVEMKVFNDNNDFNLWSLILRKKYGMDYSKYIEYLVDQGFISMVSNYYVSKKSKTYRINSFDQDSVKECVIYDKILLKKYSREFIEESITNHTSSPIDLKIRKRLVDDIYKVDIDYKNSLEYLKKLKDNKSIDLGKFYKNLNSVGGIENKHLFFKFDEYGRFHSNFTILKRDIRQKFLSINGYDDIAEVDIRNSQPLFLGLLIKNEFGEEVIYNDAEIKKFIDLVRDGLFYDYFQDKFKNLDRREIKVLIYKVLFGKNGFKSTENKIFKNVFPKIYDYIIEYKKRSNDYRLLSHKLQRMESDFIFGKVVKEIYEKCPEINIFTVHDSINFPIKYKKNVTDIFNKNLKKLF